MSGEHKRTGTFYFHLRGISMKKSANFQSAVSGAPFGRIMKTEFVNHASFIVSAGSVKLMCDPWLEGSAFHNGWSLIAASRFGYERFSEITHIRFSHEHPDHFSPPNLKKIPEAERKRIAILFQKTKGKKVIDYCRSIGFEHIRELGRNWETIAPGFRIINRPHTDGDSWLCIETEGKRLLNVNDCNLESDAEVRDIARAIGGGADILFTQFSYANAMGNRADTAVRARFAEAKIDEIRRQIRILKPEHVVPFASFVWFSHEENFFRNDAINTVEKARDEIEKAGATAVILYNGDTRKPGEKHNSDAALKKWSESYAEGISEALTAKAARIDVSDLTAAASAFCQRLRKKNSFLIRFWLQPTYIYVRDLKCAFRLSLDGLHHAETHPDHCDVQLGSEALHYCFKFEWGGSTTRINGRYETGPSGKFYRFKRYFLISQINNRRESLGLTYAAEYGKSVLTSRRIIKD